MTKKEELIEFIKNLTPAQMEKLITNLDTLQRLAETDESTARIVAGFTAALTGK